MYRLLWKIHSWMGLIAGLGLVLIGLSGSLLVFHDEIEELLNPELVLVQPTSSGRLSLDTLLTSANEQIPAHEVTGWLIQTERPQAADVLYVMPHGSEKWQIATINPYTGKVLASPRNPHETFTGWMLDFHYTFFADHTGVAIAGLFAVMLCFLGLTGFWLYRGIFKSFLTLRFGRGFRILFSDTHKFVGVTSVIFNLIVGFTGAYWNIVHVAGEWGAPHEEPKMEKRLYGDKLSLEALRRDAAGRLIGFHTNFISLPYTVDGGVTLWGAVEPRSSFSSPYGSSVTYDRQTFEHTSTSDLREKGWWARFVDMFAPLHYGTFGGVVTQVLWVIGGLAPGVLALTGFGIWWSRKRRRERIPAIA